ncbi:MAG: RDD family protein [Pyrinomonadaceae bacterium]
MQKTLTEPSNQAGVTIASHTTARPSTQPTEAESNSTLIEFPGSRSIPEWRKRLSKRVREVQEQKAREAAEEEALLRAAETVSCSLPSGQLELVPDVAQAPLNPIVSKALKRVDRARRAEHLSTGVRATAAASALAPIEEETPAQLAAPVESKPKLTIVASTVEPEPVELAADDELAITPIVAAEELADKPKRVKVISASVEDAALSYLETCLSVPAHSADTRKDMPGLTRRAFVGLIDLLLIALMVSPAVAALQAAAADWSNPRIVGLMVGITAATMFAYLTISIALTGRTLAMRLLRVRTIDERTGLIPTGGQSIKRAVGYIFSLAFFGLGLLFAFIDRDNRPLHDRFSKTIVIRN